MCKRTFFCNYTSILRISILNVVLVNLLWLISIFFLTIKFIWPDLNCYWLWEWKSSKNCLRIWFWIWEEIIQYLLRDYRLEFYLFSVILIWFCKRDWLSSFYPFHFTKLILLIGFQLIHLTLFIKYLKHAQFFLMTLFLH